MSRTCCSPTSVSPRELFKDSREPSLPETSVSISRARILENLFFVEFLNERRASLPLAIFLSSLRVQGIDVNFLFFFFFFFIERRCRDQVSNQIDSRAFLQGGRWYESFDRRVIARHVRL